MTESWSVIRARPQSPIRSQCLLRTHRHHSVGLTWALGQNQSQIQRRHQNLSQLRLSVGMAF
jgi:hypothetical protein